MPTKSLSLPSPCPGGIGVARYWSSWVLLRGWRAVKFGELPQHTSAAAHKCPSPATPACEETHILSLSLSLSLSHTHTRTHTTGRTSRRSMCPPLSPSLLPPLPAPWPGSATVCERPVCLRDLLTQSARKRPRGGGSEKHAMRKGEGEKGVEREKE